MTELRCMCEVYVNAYMHTNDVIDIVETYLLVFLQVL